MTRCDQISTLRAYSPELTGWFDDFGHSGFPDAFGGIGRISTTLNTFSAGRPRRERLRHRVLGILGVTLQRSQRRRPLQRPRALKYLPRCPGSNERGLSEDQLTQGGTVDCDPTQTPMGP